MFIIRSFSERKYRSHTQQQSGDGELADEAPKVLIFIRDEEWRLIYIKAFQGKNWEVAGTGDLAVARAALNDPPSFMVIGMDGTCDDEVILAHEAQSLVPATITVLLGEPPANTPRFTQLPSSVKANELIEVLLLLHGLRVSQT